nr:protein FAR1-RELATED SEQUENCE 3-like [Lolium perenne]
MARRPSARSAKVAGRRSRPVGTAAAWSPLAAAAPSQRVGAGHGGGSDVGGGGGRGGDGVDGGAVGLVCVHAIVGSSVASLPGGGGHGRRVAGTARRCLPALKHYEAVQAGTSLGKTFYEMDETRSSVCEVEKVPGIGVHGDESDNSMSSEHGREAIINMDIDNDYERDISEVALEENSGEEIYGVENVYDYYGESDVENCFYDDSVGGKHYVEAKPSNSMESHVDDGDDANLSQACQAENTIELYMMIKEMTFPSEEAAFVFYNSYAKDNGFSITLDKKWMIWGYVRRDLYNLCSKEKRKLLAKDDAATTIGIMLSRKEKDPSFYFDYDLDKEGRLKRMFWCDSQSVQDYEDYGDVLVFDSTYKMNRYGMPFIPFVGLNNHRRTTVFGCAIVSDEKEETYVWLLQIFLKAMCQKKPLSVITDADSAMIRAIRTVFPNVWHRICSWHVEKNMKIHLSHKSLGEFRSMLYYSTSIAEFE